MSFYSQHTRDKVSANFSGSARRAESSARQRGGAAGGVRRSILPNTQNQPARQTIDCLRVENRAISQTQRTPTHQEDLRMEHQTRITPLSRSVALEQGNNRMENIEVIESRSSTPQEESSQHGQSSGSYALKTTLRAITNMSDSIYKRFEGVEASIRNISAKVESMEEKMEVLIKSENSKDSQSKIPGDLSLSVRSSFKTLKEDQIWDLDQSFGSTFNEQKTRFLMEIVRRDTGFKFSDHLIRKSCLRYFQNVQRQHKERDDEEKFSNDKEVRRRRTRRYKLMVSRAKHISGQREIDLWDGMVPEVMSDEEDGPDGIFEVKSPAWRSIDIMNLIKVLDARREKSSNKHVARRKRLYGSPTKRAPTGKVISKFLKGEIVGLPNGEFIETRRRFAPNGFCTPEDNADDLHAHGSSVDTYEDSF